MTDQTAQRSTRHEPSGPLDSAPSRRLAQFEEELAKVRVKTGAVATESRWIALGLAAMVLGTAITLVGFFVSGSMADTRDVLSTMILAITGLCVVVAGAAVFLRYSLGRLLRAWLLRLLFEQHVDQEHRS
jgi:hypothetical protein